MKKLPENISDLKLPVTLKLNKDATGHFVVKSEKRIKSIKIKKGTIFNINPLGINETYSKSDAFKEGNLFESTILAYDSGKTNLDQVFVVFDYIELKLTAEIMPTVLKEQDVVLDKSLTILGIRRDYFILGLAFSIIGLGLYFRKL